MSTHDLWSVVGFLREQILLDPQFAHLARPVRVAHAFRNVLEHLPIEICAAETLAELVQAARENFQNYPAVQKTLLDMPKFGNNDSPVDELARKLAERFARSVTGYSDQSVRYAPSFHTLNAHIGAGMKFGASLDGQLVGQPLAKNIGPIPGRNRKGHTALMLSATTIDQSAFYGGQVLDISITPDALKTSADCRAFQSLL